MTPLAPRCTHKKSNTAGTGSESQEQQALFAWWAMAGPKLCPDRPAPVMYAIPNGGRRDAITGARLKAEGVLAGVPDIFLAVPAHGYAGLYIELKRRNGGRVSPAQKLVMQRLRSHGYACTVCHGCEAAINAIQSYLLWGEVFDGD